MPAVRIEGLKGDVAVEACEHFTGGVITDSGVEKERRVIDTHAVFGPAPELVQEADLHSQTSVRQP